MKIISKSNFDDERVDDKLIAENVDAYYVGFMVDSLNASFTTGRSPRIFHVVPDEYVLYESAP